MKDNKKIHKTSIGGQALMEGIMMRGPKEISIAVRKPNKEVIVTKEKLNTLSMRYPFLGLPFIRGVVGLVESMLIGVEALTYSAEFYEDDTSQEDEKPSILDKVFKDKAEDVVMIITVIISFAMTIGLFMVLPNLITSLFKDRIESFALLNLLEGLIRISIFLIYVYWISKIDEINRVFQYHGAEHKSIHCYEHMDDLTVENVRKYSILHPRCGTSFLFMVMIISIIVLSFFGWPNPVKRVLTRILMFPVIASISYEINRLIGRSNSKLSYILSYPGLMIQKLATVREPDDEQIEVAIAALKEVIPENREEDRW